MKEIIKRSDKNIIIFEDHEYDSNKFYVIEDTDDGEFYIFAKRVVHSQHFYNFVGLTTQCVEFGDWYESPKDAFSSAYRVDGCRLLMFDDFNEFIGYCKGEI